MLANLYRTIPREMAIERFESEHAHVGPAYEIGNGYVPEVTPYQSPEEGWVRVFDISKTEDLAQPRSGSFKLSICEAEGVALTSARNDMRHTSPSNNAVYFEGYAVTSGEGAIAVTGLYIDFNRRGILSVPADCNEQFHTEFLT